MCVWYKVAVVMGELVVDWCMEALPANFSFNLLLIGRCQESLGPATGAVAHLTDNKEHGRGTQR